ncbi:hypothetical protein NW756_010173 [Fusarium oxysporum]|nr:hypothetical protein NW763_003701 [Fusarium oxysporum]KAJ4067819.1 hypothetical protein NW753_002881 [Fusarium oxysporum]KAJ4082484.1 hypothetical protein NW756_010173 [Fusarium oxysporum]WKT46961.1 Ubiquitin-like domain superfamily [Fusarium oxysporum f. sp. vasinfectum]
MATQIIPTGSSTMTQCESIISVQTEQGKVPVKYGDDDTILGMKHQLEAFHGYPIESQEFSFSGGVPGDPVEEVGDARLVRDFAQRSGTLRLNVKSAHVNKEAAETGTVLGDDRAQQSTSNNSIGDLKMSDTGRVVVGQYHSETAVASGSGRISGAINTVSTASVIGNAKLRVGDKFGGRDPDE